MREINKAREKLTVLDDRYKRYATEQAPIIVI